MIIRPHGYAIWEHTQRALDDRFKATGHENVYFPLLIPMSLLDREADHVEGFAPQVAVVTHGGGRGARGAARHPADVGVDHLVDLRDWIQSYRDLPLLYNQWANVVRWEMRTRLFLRTTEFLWQEGHTAHATADEAHEEALQMLEVYREVAEDVLAIPVDRAQEPRASDSREPSRPTRIEGLMRDGKALQCGHLALPRAELREGLRRDVPRTRRRARARVGHVVGLLHAPGRGHDHGPRRRCRPSPSSGGRADPGRDRADPSDRRGAVARCSAVAERVRDDLAANGIRVRLDDRDQHRPGYKFAEWELKGVPVRDRARAAGRCRRPGGGSSAVRAATRWSCRWPRS